MTEVLRPTSCILSRRQLLLKVVETGLMITGVACSNVDKKVIPSGRLPAAPTPAALATKPATTSPTVAKQLANLKEVYRPVTKEDVIQIIDSAPPLYRQFGSMVNQLYSPAAPPSVNIRGVSLRVYGSTVEFQPTLTTITVHGEYNIQAPRTPKVKLQGRSFLIWLPYIDENPDRETPAQYTILNGVETFTDLAPNIRLQIPDPKFVQLTDKGIDFVLAARQLVLRKEALSLAVCLNYLGSMVNTMDKHNLSYLVMNEETPVEILTTVFKELTNLKNRFAALHDTAPLILAIKSYQDHPTMWPTILAASPEQKPLYDFIRNANIGDDPDQWVKNVYHSLIANRAFFRKWVLTGDLDKPLKS